MPQIRDRVQIHSFAIIQKNGNFLVTIDRAAKKEDLYKRYSPVNFKFFDMHGKEELKFKPGASLHDFTIDEETGQLVCKLTDAELIERDHKDKLIPIKNRLIDLYIRKDKVEQLSQEEFGDILVTIKANIAALEQELHHK